MNMSEKSEKNKIKIYVVVQPPQERAGKQTKPKHHH